MSKSLNYNRMIIWIETYKEFYDFLIKYEPKTKLVECEATFKKLPEIHIGEFTNKAFQGIHTNNKCNLHYNYSNEFIDSLYIQTKII